LCFFHLLRVHRKYDPNIRGPESVTISPVVIPAKGATGLTFFPTQGGRDCSFVLAGRTCASGGHKSQKQTNRCSDVTGAHRSLPSDYY
jgi:hypothetical protein